MIKKEIINGKVFVQQSTFYIYENEDNYANDLPDIITSSIEEFKNHKFNNTPTKKIKTNMNNNITYSQYQVKSSINRKGFFGVKVFLENKKVGMIKKVNDGWQYFPIRHKIGGEIFKTIEEVQKSLE